MSNTLESLIRNQGTIIETVEMGHGTQFVAQFPDDERLSAFLTDLPEEDDFYVDVPCEATFYIFK